MRFKLENIFYALAQVITTLTKCRVGLTRQSTATQRKRKPKIWQHSNKR
jgi:hypothetical protein